MNYKLELQNNNTDLQSLIDKANALPDKVSLDAEITTQEEKLSTQDALIASMMVALEGKAAGGTAFDYIDVTINLDINDMDVQITGPTINENNEIALLDEIIVNGATYRFLKLNHFVPPVKIEATPINILSTVSLLEVDYDAQYTLLSTDAYEIRFICFNYIASNHITITIIGQTTS